MFAVKRADPAPMADQRVIMEGITPTEYEVMLAVRGDRAGARLYYLEGALEIVSPSELHEHLKKTLARLFEADLDEHRIKAEGLGSMTLRSAPKRRGAEPDECYRLSGDRGGPPDLALEVNWTSGGLDKLEIYRGLAVREVWIWEDGALEVHALRGDHYEHLARSELIPDLDLEELARFVNDSESQSESVWAYREVLRARRGRRLTSLLAHAARSAGLGPQAARQATWRVLSTNPQP